MKLKQQDVISMIVQAIKFAQFKHDEFVAHLIEQGHPETAKAAEAMVDVEVESTTIPDMGLHITEMADLTIAVLNYAHINQKDFLEFLAETKQTDLVPFVGELDMLRQHFSSVSHQVMELFDD